MACSTSSDNPLMALRMSVVPKAKYTRIESPQRPLLFDLLGSGYLVHDVAPCLFTTLCHDFQTL